ncbi:MAG: diacylglycerol kinase [Treponema sp.]|jgi:diacylglycerol kinase family enzyme|nr:diacylglycerol kinase [Treponema sp.]
MSNAKNLTPGIFADFMVDLCGRSPLATGSQLNWTIIANPKAGGFTMRSRWNKHNAQLLSCASKAMSNPVNPQACPSQTALAEGDKRGLILTKARGHAEEITRRLIEEASSANKNSSGKAKPLYLIITAGGDGTSLEVQNVLCRAPAEIRERFAVLRLPMGTGNDGADAFELEEALRRIIEPAEISFRRSVRLVTSTPGKGPFLAFNILSVGLDAFVTHMTNKMKGTLPGDFYKLWVDIASLFYDRVYKVGSMDVRALDDKGNEVSKFREKVLLLAVGESGHRCYGSQNHILPDDRNVCWIRQMPLLRKIALKGLFPTGAHINKPECTLFNASRVEISGEHPILAQMDGETVLLQKADYPIAIELSEPVIPVLRL